MGNSTMSQVIQKVAGFPSLECVSSNTSLAQAEIELVPMVAREMRLKEAIEEIRQLREDFYADVSVPGAANELNQELEKALRVADFIELGQLMAKDALDREESCGGHFREEYQDAEGETLRDDEKFGYVAAWEYNGSDASKSVLHKEELKYEFIKIAARNYK